MSVPEFHQSLTVRSVDQCFNISCLTSDRVWVSDGDNLILTNITGATIHRVENSCIGSCGGSHTVNSESELIYIDVNYNIKTLSKDMKSTSTYIENTDYPWRPQCVYWCPSNGDLLVGMYRNFTETGKVIRFNQSGKQTQTIQYDNKGMGLYNNLICLTENNNGDVVVSDAESISECGTLVVTEREGRHRYSYTGHPPRSLLLTRGICTDALSHILVCDHRTKSVQMLDKDGYFLSHLLIRPPGIFTPHSLSYHTNTHRLWVGSVYNTKLCVYRYIARHDTLSDMNPASAGVMESLSVVPYKETKKHLQEDERLLKLMSTIELFNFFTRQGVDGCYHISCVISNLFWVSDADNLILADTAGFPLHHVDDLCRDLYGGSHTVTSESELFYIDRNYNINKLSKNMKTTTTIIEKKDSTWLPGCVYWSPSTRDLLVGMFREKILSGKVNRFNQSGQQTLTIQHDSTGLELYRYANYITENNNGDVVVSDADGAIVVTDREGRHRFSYTGHPSGSGLDPRGICTDVLSHILVCDVTDDTVHMLDKDGHFLSYLLTKSQDIDIPCSLSYDVNTHRLWVGSWYNNKVCVYRFTDRHDALTDDSTFPLLNDE
uniref:Tripartite motif-containing protein 3 n=1 Tax=Magallana gigas TaxID=29159 RepID=K1R5W4_MAGGI